MKTTLKSVWTLGVNGKIKKVIFSTEITVTADTTEDTLEEVLEAIREIVLEIYGDTALKTEWNDAEIFRIADKLAA